VDTISSVLVWLGIKFDKEKLELCAHVSVC
jgi:hypothetical protein